MSGSSSTSYTFIKPEPDIDPDAEKIKTPDNTNNGNDNNVTQKNRVITHNLIFQLDSNTLYYIGLCVIGYKIFTNLNLTFCNR